jgi:hypothetical protein
VSILRVSVLLLLLLVFASQLFMPMAAAETSAAQAASALASADRSVSSAYQAVWEAEGSGANVSALVFRLNATAGLLSEAEVANQSGDFDGTASMANQCITLANGVLSDALALKSSALAGAQRVFWLTLIFSSVGAGAFAVVLVLVWGWFSRRYTRKLLKMKPVKTVLKGVSVKSAR